MKKIISIFIQRGFVGATFGPLVLATIYGILGAVGTVEALSVSEVVLGIVSVTLMAFIAAGITVVYQIEKLPLISALLIHGFALYIDYAIMYLINSWIEDGIVPFLIFTAIFIVGYALIWGIIYACIKAKTDKLNKSLSK